MKAQHTVEWLIYQVTWVIFSFNCFTALYQQYRLCSSRWEM